MKAFGARNRDESSAQSEIWLISPDRFIWASFQHWIGSDSQCNMTYDTIQSTIKFTWFLGYSDAGFIKRFIERKYLYWYMSGWPSGLRRQTQELSCIHTSEHSGPRMWAWVQIPLLTTLFPMHIAAPITIQLRPPLAWGEIPGPNTASTHFSFVRPLAQTLKVSSNLR